MPSTLMDKPCAFRCLVASDCCKGHKVLRFLGQDSAYRLVLNVGQMDYQVVDGPCSTVLASWKPADVGVSPCDSVSVKFVSVKSREWVWQNVGEGWKLWSSMWLISGRPVHDRMGMNRSEGMEDEGTCLVFYILFIFAYMHVVLTSRARC
jgi:hypothetical protein